MRDAPSTDAGALTLASCAASPVVKTLFGYGTWSNLHLRSSIWSLSWSLRWLLGRAHELVDRTGWGTRTQLASAMFEWIEGFYNPSRRHFCLGNLGPADYETLHTAAEGAA